MSLAFDPSSHRDQYNTPWNAATNERLRFLWVHGFAIAKIANILTTEFGPDFTWRSVLRRVHRARLPKRNLSVWTAEVESRCRELYDAGDSGTQIANKLNTEFGLSLTRNAVIGKFTRLEFPKRAPRITKPKRERKPNRVPFCNLKTAKDRYGRKQPMMWLVPPTVDLEIPAEQRKTLMELGPHDCRFPVGEVGKPGFFFCGAAVTDDKPYCSGHCVRAFRPPLERGKYEAA